MDVVYQYDQCRLILTPYVMLSCEFAITQKIQEVIFSSVEHGCESERRVHCNE